MKKTFTSVKACLLLVILLISISVACISGGFSDSTASAARSSRPKLFSFNSYIDIEYDPTPLNENLQIEKSINVPLTVKYWTDAPENFLQFLPWQLRNIFLFGSMIGPMQKLHMEIIDKPEWADIYISQEDILMNIPLGGQEKAATVTTSLILSPLEEAPAQPYSIKIKISCEAIGRINGFEQQEALDFTPSFIPTIQITPENPTRTVGPRESVNFVITVKNEGNKKTRVIPSIVDANSKWTPTINPPFADIDSGDQADFTFSVYSPYDFGWHNENQPFEIEFTSKIFPLRDDAPVGGPYSIYLRVVNHGFSTPGFEILIFIAALGIAGILIKKRKHL